MTDAELDALHNLAAAATPGPFIAEPSDRDGPVWVVGAHDKRGSTRYKRIGECYGGTTHKEDVANAALFAASRTAIPDLVAEVWRLRTQLQAVTAEVRRLQTLQLPHLVVDGAQRREHDRRVEALTTVVLRDIRARLDAQAEQPPDEQGSEEHAVPHGKPQAGEWRREDTGSGNVARFFHDSDSASADLAAEVYQLHAPHHDTAWSGWWVFGPDDTGLTTSFPSGSETGLIGQCLADLCLCAHGYLATDRIVWPSDAHRAAIEAFPGTPPWTGLTVETLPLVLAAVRAVPHD